MARSQEDDPTLNEMHRWNFCLDNSENCGSVKADERKVLPNTHILNDNNNRFVNPNLYSTNNLYNKIPFNMNASPDDSSNNEEPVSFSNIQNVNGINNLQKYAVLNLANGQVVRVFYDENNQPQFMIPVTSQYELFNNNQGIRPGPIQNVAPSTVFTDSPDYAPNTSNHPVASNTSQNLNFGNISENIHTNSANMPTSNFLKDVLGNWEPNLTGTYSPFGHNYPLNHPEVPLVDIQQTNSNATDEAKLVSSQKNVGRSPKRNENSPLADTGTKKRIVAEVKPMRPTYSDVLAKNAKTASQPESTRKAKVTNGSDPKHFNKTSSLKTDKYLQNNIKMTNDDPKHKHEKTKSNVSSQMSSGSDSGDINTDDYDKPQKSFKRSKSKRTNISRKWSSLDDINTEDDTSFKGDEGDYSPQFVLIQNRAEKPPKKDKKGNGNKNKARDKSVDTEEELPVESSAGDAEFEFQEAPTESTKAKKKLKETRNHLKSTGKSSLDKKKPQQGKWKRNKPGGYVDLAHNYWEHWSSVTWKAMVWFCYLLSDICHMSLHLSFDLCTSVFTQTYISSQAIWRSSKDWFSKVGDNKYLLYIDRKFGHTKFGIWRKLKWFKKAPVESEGNDSSKLNANIPLPATGEEAMKRLLACKGKDPYSILGVNMKCSDDDIKRYYRRQAFLVHPDKNQQPGAEEAFKILQHAFDLIGEPERRESYDRRAVESRHVEAAWSELSQLLAQLHDKMEFAANTIRCTNCGRRHKRVITDRPCYAARYCSQCKIRHSAKEGDIWAESGMFGLLVMYFACMDGAVYQITQWASCQKKNLKQLKPDCHAVQYRIVLGNKAGAAPTNQRSSTSGHDPSLEDFLNTLYSKSGQTSPPPANKQTPPNEPADPKFKRRNKKTKP